jgi:D-lactate dehydrogenase (cytochrome)
MNVVSDTFVDALRQVVGNEHIITGEGTEPFVTDVYRQGVQPLAVASPDTVEQVAALVQCATQANIAVLARGGGASYTDGYLPRESNSLLIDFSRLNRVIEVNAEDGYVLVEAGVTWAQLKAHLDPLGFRTLFFGPFSGIAATIGGSISQNSISHGSGAHGVSAQSLLCLDVVIASGEILRTGSASVGGPPVQRYFGPDLCGLFTGDCGALGIKVRAALPLIRAKPAWQAASFACATLADLVALMHAAAMEQLDDENFAIDSALAQGQLMRQQSMAARASAARAILGAAPSLLGGLGQLIRFGLAGTSKMAQAAFVAHFICDGVDQSEVTAKIKRLRALAKGRSDEIAPTVPTFVHASPFAPLFNTLGPRGERWVPIHGILAPSRVLGLDEAIRAVFAREAERMRALGVWVGFMFENVGSSGFLYEIAFYWPGQPNAFHRAKLTGEFLAGLPAYEHSQAALDLVHALKTEIIELYRAHGATHFQLGKVYPYTQSLMPQTLSLIRAIKAELDPRGLMNPGALGL